MTTQLQARQVQIPLTRRSRLPGGKGAHPVTELAFSVATLSAAAHSMRFFSKETNGNVTELLQ
jgi:hypothetical protein